MLSIYRLSIYIVIVGCWRTTSNSPSRFWCWGLVSVCWCGWLRENEDWGCLGRKPGSQCWMGWCWCCCRIEDDCIWVWKVFWGVHLDGWIVLPMYLLLHCLQVKQYTMFFLRQILLFLIVHVVLLHVRFVFSFSGLSRLPIVWCFCGSCGLVGLGFCKREQFWGWWCHWCRVIWGSRMFSFLDG